MIKDFNLSHKFIAQCIHCGDNLTHQHLQPLLEDMDNHLEKCAHNPINKACFSCNHMYEGYCDPPDMNCRLKIKIPYLDVIRNCKKWKELIDQE